jgi:hypothetical protein
MHENNMQAEWSVKQIHILQAPSFLLKSKNTPNLPLHDRRDEEPEGRKGGMKKNGDQKIHVNFPVRERSLELNPRETRLVTWSSIHGQAFDCQCSFCRRKEC